MKTAMQQLIEYLNENGLLKLNEITAIQIETKINELLEEEKRQIVDAYEQGHYKPDFSEIGVSIVEEGKKYYNQTYNNENKQDTVQ